MNKKQYSVPVMQVIAAEKTDVICASVNFGNGTVDKMHSKKREHANTFDDDDDLFDNSEIFMQSESIL